MNRTNTVFSDTVVNNAIVFPWFSTWLVNITQMFAFTWWVSTSVSIATVAWLFSNSVNNSIGSSAKIDGQWFFWASWWADTSFLHAHAGVSNSLTGLFASVFLGLFVEIASVVDSGGDFIGIAD
jgi:hypothetical protein